MVDTAYIVKSIPASVIASVNLFLFQCAGEVGGEGYQVSCIPAAKFLWFYCASAQLLSIHSIQDLFVS